MYSVLISLKKLKAGLNAVLGRQAEAFFFA